MRNIKLHKASIYEPQYLTFNITAILVYQNVSLMVYLQINHLQSMYYSHLLADHILIYKRSELIHSGEEKARGSPYYDIPVLKGILSTGGRLTFYIGG